MPARRSRWWLGFLGLLAGCAAVTALTVTWLGDLVAQWVEAEYLPNLDDLRWSSVVLAAIWAGLYSWVGRPGDPWQPFLAVYRNLLAPGGFGSLARSVLSAVPLNVLLVAAASLLDAAFGYAQDGSQLRDSLYRLVFVLLAVAGIVRYLASERSRT